MGAAFLLVAVEQPGAGLALDHHRELPGQVARVAHAAVVALTLPHRHDVRGIAGRRMRPTQRAAERALWVGRGVEHRQHRPPVGQRLAERLQRVDLKRHGLGHQRHAQRDRRCRQNRHDNERRLPAERVADEGSAERVSACASGQHIGQRLATIFRRADRRRRLPPQA